MYWYLEALKYPASEQRAENMLKDIEILCLYYIKKGIPRAWAYNLGVFYEGHNKKLKASPDFAPTFEKAKFWYTQALGHPTSQENAQRKLATLEEYIHLL